MHDDNTAPCRSRYCPESAVEHYYAPIGTLSMGGPVLMAHEQNLEERLSTVVDVREYKP